MLKRFTAGGAKVAPGSPKTGPAPSPIILNVKRDQGISAGELLSANMILEFRMLWSRLRKASNYMFCFSFLGIVLNVVQRELTFAYGTAELSESAALIHIQYSPTWVGSVIFGLRWFSSLATLATIYELSAYYSADHAFLCLSRAYLGESPFWHTRSKRKFWLEVAMVLCHEPPFLNYAFKMSIHDSDEDMYIVNILGLLMFFRVYMIWRVVSHAYYSGGTKVIGLWNRFEFTPAFVIRNFLHDQPIFSICAVTAVVVVMTSYQLYFIERGPFASQATMSPMGSTWTYFDSVWCTLITMTSVGFGDMYPASIVGRIVCLWAAFLGVVLIAVVTAIVMDLLTLFPYESRVVQFLQQARAQEKAKVLAALVIQRMWRYRKACRSAGTQMLSVLKTEQSQFEDENIERVEPANEKKGKKEKKIIKSISNAARRRHVATETRRNHITQVLKNKGCGTRLLMVMGWQPLVVKRHRQAIEGVFDFCEFRKKFRSLDQRKNNAEMIQAHVRDVKEYIAYQQSFYDDKALENTPFEHPDKAAKREAEEQIRYKEANRRKALSALRLNAKSPEEVTANFLAVQKNSKPNLRDVFKRVKANKAAEVVGATLQALKAIKQVKAEGLAECKAERQQQIGGVYGRVLELSLENKQKTDTELFQLRKQQSEIMNSLASIQLQLARVLPLSAPTPDPQLPPTPTPSSREIDNVSALATGDENPASKPSITATTTDMVGHDFLEDS